MSLPPPVDPDAVRQALRDLEQRGHQQSPVPGGNGTGPSNQPEGNNGEEEEEPEPGVSHRIKDSDAVKAQCYLCDIKAHRVPSADKNKFAQSVIVNKFQHLRLDQILYQLKKYMSEYRKRAGTGQKCVEILEEMMKQGNNLFTENDILGVLHKWYLWWCKISYIAIPNIPGCEIEEKTDEEEVKNDVEENDDDDTSNKLFVQKCPTILWKFLGRMSSAFTAKMLGESEWKKYYESEDERYLGVFAQYIRDDCMITYHNAWMMVQAIELGEKNPYGTQGEIHLQAGNAEHDMRLYVENECMDMSSSLQKRFFYVNTAMVAMFSMIDPSDLYLGTNVTIIEHPSYVLDVIRDNDTTHLRRILLRGFEKIVYDKVQSAVLKHMLLKVNASLEMGDDDDIDSSIVQKDITELDTDTVEYILLAELKNLPTAEESDVLIKRINYYVAALVANSVISLGGLPPPVSASLRQRMLISRDEAITANLPTDLADHRRAQFYASEAMFDIMVAFEQEVFTPLTSQIFLLAMNGNRLFQFIKEEIVESDSMLLFVKILEDVADISLMNSIVKRSFLTTCQEKFIEVLVNRTAKEYKRLIDRQLKTKMNPKRMLAFRAKTGLSEGK